MLNVALPLLSVPVPSVVLPSLNVTVPVAADGVTVAVNVTEVPYVEGFGGEDSVVDVAVAATAILANAKQITTNHARKQILVILDPSSLPRKTH